MTVPIPGSEFDQAHTLLDQVGVPREDPPGWLLTLTDRVAILCDRYDMLLFDSNLQHKVLDRLGVQRQSEAGLSYPPDSRVMLAKQKGTHHWRKQRSPNPVPARDPR